MGQKPAPKKAPNNAHLGISSTYFWPIFGASNGSSHHCRIDLLAVLLPEDLASLHPALETDSPASDRCTCFDHASSRTTAWRKNPGRFETV